jgi:pilus assembly protein Flp/PilA
MKNMKQLLKNLMTEESGQDLIEYALVAALVGLGSVAAMTGLSNSIANTFAGVGNALTSVNTSKAHMSTNGAHVSFTRYLPHYLRHQRS